MVIFYFKCIKHLKYIDQIWIKPIDKLKWNSIFKKQNKILKKQSNNAKEVGKSGTGEQKIEVMTENK